MQASHFQIIKEKLIAQVIPEFAVAIGRSRTIDGIQNDSKELFNQIAEIVFPEHRVEVKTNKEPQSEEVEIIEETKDEPDFSKMVIKEYNNFLEALSTFELVQVKHISDLTNWKNL